MAPPQAEAAANAEMRYSPVGVQQARGGLWQTFLIVT
jgi:hypothetical protein